MSAKKSLYHPAPEHLVPSTTASLPQGDSSNASRKNVPKIKQGVLETSQRGSKPLTSTLKSAATSKSSSLKPVIVCHNPTAVHSQLHSSNSSVETKVATDTVQSPKSIVIQPKLDVPLGLSQDKRKKQRPTSAKKGRFVSSRYMQAAADVTTTSNSKLSTTKRSMTRPSKDLSGSYSSKTPSLRPTKPGKTSTPASAKGSSFDWNASAIEKAQGSFNRMEETIENSSDESLSAAFEDPEILYCQYMQWHLLNQTVRQNMRKKAKQYTEQLNFLHDKNSDHSKDIENLKKEVILLEHQCLLESQLSSQRAAMAPAVDKLQSALGSCRLLAENLDTTRHSLPLVDIQDPDPFSLETTLDETRNLLGQINILTRSQAPVVESMAKSVEALRKNCVQEAGSLPSTRAELKDGVASVLQHASLVCQLASQES